MYTQCPVCKTIFNVKPEQLGAAQGKVRCSRCQSIFNAKENAYAPPTTRTAQDRAPTATATKPQTVKAPPPAAATDSTQPQQKKPPAAKPPRREKPAIPDKPGKERAETAEPPADEWFDLTPSPASKPAPRKKTPPPATPAVESPAEKQPPSIEDELNEDLFKLFDEPEIVEPSVASPEPLPAVEEIGSKGETAKTAAEDKPKHADKKTAAEEESGSEKKTAAPEGPSGEEAPTTSGGYSLPPQLESRPVRATMRTFFYALSNLMLIAALAVQYAYSHRIPLRENETLRPWLDTLCQVSNCPLPPQRDLDKIELVDNMMQSHPRYQDSLLITATLINRADYVQPYPIVEIVMSDLQQNVVARRTFRPEEYLVGDTAEMEFTPNVEMALMLEVADPGNNAVGFKFDFY